jgi:Lysine methyltransferase
LAHFLARNARKGEFARHKVKGKHALELGSGMGLGGLALAMLGELHRRLTAMLVDTVRGRLFSNAGST